MLLRACLLSSWGRNAPLAWKGRSQGEKWRGPRPEAEGWGASGHSLTGDSSLHMGMGVAGKREDMVPSKASAEHPLICVRELAGRRARWPWKVQRWEW